jgi:hypothetical protein
MRTNIDAGPFPDDGAGDVVLGSREFFDSIVTGPGDDEIRTGAGGSFVDSGAGRDVVRLGAGREEIFLSPGGPEVRRIVVHGFGTAQDVVTLYDIHSDFPRVLDTNGDGWVDARDRTVRIDRPVRGAGRRPRVAHPRRPDAGGLGPLRAGLRLLTHKGVDRNAEAEGRLAGPPPDEPEADQAGGEVVESLQDIGPPLVADDEAAVAGEPGQRALYHPAVAAQAVAAVHPAAGDPGDDARLRQARRQRS